MWGFPIARCLQWLSGWWIIFILTIRLNFTIIKYLFSIYFAQMFMYVWFQTWLFFALGTKLELHWGFKHQGNWTTGLHWSKFSARGLQERSNSHVAIFSLLLLSSSGLPNITTFLSTIYFRSIRRSFFDLLFIFRNTNFLTILAFIWNLLFTHVSNILSLVFILFYFIFLFVPLLTTPASHLVGFLPVFAPPLTATHGWSSSRCERWTPLPPPPVPWSGGLPIYLPRTQEEGRLFQ